MFGNTILKIKNGLIYFCFQFCFYNSKNKAYLHSQFFFTRKKKSYLHAWLLSFFK